MGNGLAPSRAARLAAQLPAKARVRLSLLDEGERELADWTYERRILAAIFNCVRWIQWSQSKAAHENPGNPPEPIGPPDMTGRAAGEGLVLPGDDYKALLNEMHSKGEGGA